jgi:hypothetical protein
VGKYKARNPLAPEQFRLPASSASASNSLQFWDRVFTSQLDPSVPVLLVSPEQYWLDAIAGEPTPREFFCLRASPRALSLSTLPEEQWEPTGREEAQSLVDDLVRGETNGGTKTEERSESRWMSRLFG